MLDALVAGNSGVVVDGGDCGWCRRDGGWMVINVGGAAA